MTNLPAPAVLPNSRLPFERHVFRVVAQVVLIFAAVRRAVRLCRAVVEGVAFFDFLHGQTGVAPNGIELHPILGFRCLS